MKLRLRHKVIGLAICSALLPVLAMALIMEWQQARVASRVDQEIDRVTNYCFHLVVSDVYNSCVASNGLMQRRVDDALSVAHMLVQKAGPVTFSGETKVAWEAQNQVSRQKSRIELPQMRIGDVAMIPGRSADDASPIVDDVRRLLGAQCSIFQRMNEAGDMLRVDTTVLTTEGQRALGTYIPAVEPDGKPNPVVAAIRRGERYRGSAFAVDDWYLTAYEPLRDATGAVVGMLSVGVLQESEQALRSAIQSAEIGNKGYIFVTYGRDVGNETRFVLVQGKQVNEQNAQMLLDVKGRPVFREIADRALRLKAGQVAQETLVWQDGRDNEPVEKHVVYAYYPDWNWVVGLVAYPEDTLGPKQEAERAIDELQEWSTLGGISFLVLAVGLAWLLGGYLARPIGFLTDVSRRVAAGDISGASTLLQQGSQARRLERAQDETGQLYAAIVTMTENLGSLIGQVKSASRQLVSTAAEIGGAAKLQENTMHDFGSSTNEIAAAVKEISATSQELCKTMGSVAESANTTAEVAARGQGAIAEREAAIKLMTEATASISTRLNAISDKANAINGVVTTITKIADQTNLLSLNAAIEAEKAGEYGLGFAVVAREVRRLADQTAVATLDIEEMVREMQAAVSSGVSEMGKFSVEIKEGMDKVAEMGHRMGDILRQVQALTPRFDAVTEGMQSQALGARQISEAVSGLNSAARQTTLALDGFNRTARSLQDAVEALNKAMSKFSVETSNGQENRA